MKVVDGRFCNNLTITGIATFLPMGTVSWKTVCISHLRPYCCSVNSVKEGVGCYKLPVEVKRRTNHTTFNLQRFRIQMIIHCDFNVTAAGIKETGFINFCALPIEYIISPDHGVIFLLYTKMIFCLKWFGKERVIQCLSSPGSQSHAWRTSV